MTINKFLTVLCLSIFLLTTVYAQSSQYKITGALIGVEITHEQSQQINFYNKIQNQFSGVSSDSKFIMISGYNPIDELKYGRLFQNNGEITKVNIPKEYKLFTNYPNPFNPATTIRYDLPVDETVIVKIFGILGQEINVLVNDRQTAGEKFVIWNGKDKYGQTVSSGIYLCRIQAGNFIKSIKLVLMK